MKIIPIIEPVPYLHGTIYAAPFAPLRVECQAGESRDEVFGWLDEYFARRRPLWMPKMRLEGTPFQQKVWQLLLEVPYGETVSYGELARRISPTMSAQAVGQAVGRNPCPIVVPCHRVTGSRGALGGYAFGLGMKRWLLDFEQGR